MKSVSDYLNSHPAIRALAEFAFALGIILLLIAMSGCANTTLTTAQRRTIPYNENDQNAGVIEEFDNHSLHITASKLEEYNQLISDYGQLTLPKTAKNFGVTDLKDGTYYLTAQGAERFYELILIRQRVLQGIKK